MKEFFVDKDFRTDSLYLIQVANQVLDAYHDAGYVLSLRQLYYQLVSRDIIPNNLKEYKRLGNIVGDARLAGLIDWDMIEDREREVVYPSHWESASDIVLSAYWSFRMDHWEGQPNYVEVMVEKKALEGVLIPVCQELDVRFTANRGYSSLSAMYEAGKRIAAAANEGREVHILYLGDHDPSGLDMDRDILERLELFSGEYIDVERLALTYDQVEEYGPPENPAKLTDSRAPAYINTFGYSSWELDALEPTVLAGLVTNAVEALRDDEIYEEVIERETVQKALLHRAYKEWKK